MNTPAQAAAAAHDDSLIAHLMRVPRKRLFRVHEVAEILDVSRWQVLALLDSGDLESHDMTRRKVSQIGLWGEGLNEKGRIAERQRRACTRVTRRSVIMFLATSARYSLSAEEHSAVIAQMLRDLPNTALEAIRSECSKQLAVRATHQ